MADTFTYKVRDRQGKLVEGALEADNAQLVVAKLREMGYVPIDIQQKQAKSSLSRSTNGASLPRSRTVRARRRG